MEKTNRFGAYKPEDFLIDLVDRNGNTVKYMTNQGRVIAFRNEFPNGKIRVEEKFYHEQGLFVVTAYIYADKNDDKDSYLASEFGTRVFENKDSLPEAATQAITRALGRCGFGTAYSSPDEGFDGTVSEAGMLSKRIIPDTADMLKTSLSQKTTHKTSTKKTETKTETKKKEKTESKKKDLPPTEDIAEDITFEEVIKDAVYSPETAPMPPVEEQVDKPVEEDEPSMDLDTMTLEEAKKVMITFGQKKGQYMGEVFATDPKAIKWFATEYAGKSEEIKRAAQIIMAAS